MDSMPRVRAIWESPAFRDALASIDGAERDREFCGHGVAHLVDVARVAWILNLERGLGLDREVVYAAAFLHDVGRAAQYATGEPHDAAGERMAAELLDALPGELAFPASGREAILAAVRGHRGDVRIDRGGAGEGARRAVEGGDGGGDSPASTPLASIIREADGRSRPCYACPAREACYWPDERKNLSIEV